MSNVDGTGPCVPTSIPGHLGIVLTHVSGSRVTARLQVTHQHIAANGFLRAGAVVTLADTAAGHGCFASLPPGASGFATIELKSNHLSTAHDGTIECVATPVHQGRATQVWDAVVTHVESDRAIAVFRCTQMILYRDKPTRHTSDFNADDTQ